MNTPTQKKIKYGIVQWAFPSMELEATARTISEIGLDGIQLDTGKCEGVELEMASKDLQLQWLEACENNHLQIPALAVNALCGAGMSKPEKKDLVMPILEKSVEIANDMKIPVLQLPSFFDGFMKTEKDIETTAERLQEVCDLAKDYDIVVGSENTLGVDDNLKLLSLTNRDNMKIFFDSQNPWAFEGIKVPEVLSGLYPHIINTIHTKDGNGEDVASKPLGEGDSDTAETMTILSDYNYEGWIVLENDYMRIEKTENWKSNIQADVAYVEKMLNS